MSFFARPKPKLPAPPPRRLRPTPSLPQELAEALAQRSASYAEARSPRRTSVPNEHSAPIGNHFLTTEHQDGWELRERLGLAVKD